MLGESGIIDNDGERILFTVDHHVRILMINDEWILFLIAEDNWLVIGIWLRNGRRKWRWQEKSRYGRGSHGRRYGRQRDGRRNGMMREGRRWDGRMRNGRSEDRRRDVSGTGEIGEVRAGSEMSGWITRGIGGWII